MQFTTLALAVVSLAAPLASAACYRLQAEIITNAWGREDLLTARVILRQDGVHVPICDNWTNATRYKKSDGFAKIGCFTGKDLTGILTIVTDGGITEYDPANRKKVYWINKNVKKQELGNSITMNVVDERVCV